MKVKNKGVIYAFCIIAILVISFLNTNRTVSSFISESNATCAQIIKHEKGVRGIPFITYTYVVDGVEYKSSQPEDYLWDEGTKYFTVLYLPDKPNKSFLLQMVSHDTCDQNVPKPSESRLKEFIDPKRFSF